MLKWLNSKYKVKYLKVAVDNILELHIKPCGGYLKLIVYYIFKGGSTIVAYILLIVCGGLVKEYWWLSNNVNVIVNKSDVSIF